MKTPPHNWHLCAYCKRVVSIVSKDYTILKEMPLSESGFTVESFDVEGAGHGICHECDKAQRALHQRMREAKKKGKVLSNPPVWAVDKAKWNKAVRIVRRSYGL